MLSFNQAGKSKRFGLTFDRVSLTQEGSNKNYIENSDFDRPLDEGWFGKDIEIIDGRTINQGWFTPVVRFNDLKSPRLRGLSQSVIVGNFGR